MDNTLRTHVRFGEFGLDLTSGRLRGPDQTVYLPEKPLRILTILIEFEGGLVSREDIKKRLWPNDTAVDFEHGINTAIKSLRRALGDSADQPTYIETVPRRGYRLMVPAERVEESSSGGEPLDAQSDGDTLGLAAKASRGELIGRTVSHYRVLQVIGGGGMGIVYRAEDLKLGRAVALKFLPEELGSDPLALERFGREARAASSLDHSNICAIHEFGEHEGHPFIVMQLLEGQTLRDRLLHNQGPLPLPELLGIASQVSSGLAAAHEKGIIHRDIKPANIFITNKGVCKILDFGLAKLLEAEEGAEAMSVPLPSSLSDVAMPALVTLTRTGATMGTAGYMSPEQVRGENLDARTDIFSFGLVLYEMATGHRAFSGETAAIVHDAILQKAAVPLKEQNPSLPLKVVSIIDKAMEKNRELRYPSAAELLADFESFRRELSPQPSSTYLSRHKALLAMAGLVVMVMVAAVLYWRFHKAAPAFAEQGTLVIADFSNTTGDPVFDGALRQALTLQLEQSPYLKVLAAGKVRATLQQMERSPAQPITEQIATEVCMRTHSNAVLAGSIAQTGNSYDLVLKALTCESGNPFAVVEAQANNRKAVLPALAKAASQMRARLGESLASVKRYGQPLVEATTSSLEALQVLSKTTEYGSPSENIPYVKRAIELDPNFAYAYAQLGAAYWNVGEEALGAKSITRAFELRESVSLRERFYIETTYYCLVTRELEKAEQSAKEWAHNYPESWQPHNSLSIIYAELGKPDEAVREIKEVIRIVPENSGAYANLVGMASAANQLDVAQHAYDQARARNLDSPYLREYRYNLAFLQGDEAVMREQLQWAAGKPRTEDVMFAQQADTEAYYGRIRQSREYSQRAVHSAKSAGAMESAALWTLRHALVEAELESSAVARRQAQEGLALNHGRDARINAALVLARTGDVAKADALSDALNAEFPLDTVLQNVALPCIRAAVLLQQDKPLQALEVLSVSRNYELSQGTITFVYPAYLRGEAYLKSGQPERAGAEFQVMLTHRGIVGNFVTGALSHLQLARAQAMMGDKDAARKSYQDFLTLWKDADPDIPIYQQAKAEYAKLTRTITAGSRLPAHRQL
jgi:serine/threonine protein kinase/tetratricopeptide (TPR) repeat protein